MSDIAYKELSQAETVFKSLIWDNGVLAAEAALFIYIPWLGMSPLRQITQFIVNHLSDLLFQSMVLCVDVAAIRLVNSEHQKAFDRASIVLKIIAYEKGIESPEFERARENAKAQLALFVRFGAARV